MEDLKAEQEDLQAGIDARDGLDMANEKGIAVNRPHRVKLANRIPQQEMIQRARKLL